MMPPYKRSPIAQISHGREAKPSAQDVLLQDSWTQRGLASPCAGNICRNHGTPSPIFLLTCLCSPFPSRVPLFPPLELCICDSELAAIAKPWYLLICSVLRLFQQPLQTQRF